MAEKHVTDQDVAVAGSESEGLDPVERSFRKGNINFDFLQPEGESQSGVADVLPPEERRSGKRDGKRGLFRRGRKPITISILYQIGWLATALGSLMATGWILFGSKSWLFLLLLPFLLSAFLWSLIMLTLFLARPR